MTPEMYAKLSPEGQRNFINSLAPVSLFEFSVNLKRWMQTSSKQADMLSMFGSAATTDNVRFNLTMLKRSREDTLVDVIARFPQLKQVPAVMELVSQDFARVIHSTRNRRQTLGY